MSWSRSFDAPIPLPEGGELATLRQAGNYVAALSKGRQREPHWQTAAAELLAAAERGGIVMLAEIAMRKALNHGRPEPPRNHAASRRRNTGSSAERFG